MGFFPFKLKYSLLKLNFNTSFHKYSYITGEGYGDFFLQSKSYF